MANDYGRNCMRVSFQVTEECLFTIGSLFLVAISKSFIVWFLQGEDNTVFGDAVQCDINDENTGFEHLLSEGSKSGIYSVSVPL